MSDKEHKLSILSTAVAFNAVFTILLLGFTVHQHVEINKLKDNIRKIENNEISRKAKEINRDESTESNKVSHFGEIIVMNILTSAFLNSY